MQDPWKNRKVVGRVKNLKSRVGTKVGARRESRRLVSEQEDSNLGEFFLNALPLGAFNAQC